MKKQFLIDKSTLGYAMVLICSLTACATTTGKPGEIEYNKPLNVVKQAGMDAMAVNGFEVTQNNATYIEGHRPRTLGLFCTPGGETAGIWLEQKSQSRTRVRINSEKSFLGKLCQRDWTEPILGEMENSLGQGK